MTRSLWSADPAAAIPKPAGWRVFLWPRAPAAIDGSGSSSTRLSLYLVCVYPKVACEGDASCIFWDGMSQNVYGFYGPVRSLRVMPTWLNLPALDIRYGELVLSEGTFVAALSPMSGQKMVTVGKSSPDLSARLPANALVRQISLSTAA